MSTRIGIVGMPNAGKSSLFNALTKAGAEAANYPFTTIEPNVAVVPVRDRRLEQVAATVGASEIVWDTIDFHDIAGLVAGAHKGEGLGNSSWPTSARPTRSCTSCARTATRTSIHPEGSVDPLRDIETIETELVLADLEQAERRVDRVAKQARGGDKAAAAEEAWLREVIAELQAGRPVRGVPAPEEAPHAARDLGSLTAKPVLFVANVDEGSDEVPAAIAEHAAAQGARAVAVSSRIESELSELDDEEAAAMRAELSPAARRSDAARARRPGGVRAAGAARVLHRRRGQAGAVLAPAPRPDRCGTPRARSTPTSRRGFVRAEVIGWQELVDAGGYAGARERGTLRIEGRDYAMADGDVITVKFTP